MKTVSFAIALFVLTAAPAQANDDVASLVEALVAAHAVDTAGAGDPGERTQGVGGSQKITAISPDGLQILISQLQAGQRWAVGLMTEPPFSLSGNVVGESSSTLMWCEAKGTADQEESLVFDCSSPEGEVATSDSGWNLFAEGVSVPGSFFAP